MAILTRRTVSNVPGLDPDLNTNVPPTSGGSGTNNTYSVNGPTLGTISVNPNATIARFPAGTSSDYRNWVSAADPTSSAGGLTGTSYDAAIIKFRGIEGHGSAIGTPLQNASKSVDYQLENINRGLSAQSAIRGSLGNAAAWKIGAAAAQAWYDKQPGVQATSRTMLGQQNIGEIVGSGSRTVIDSFTNHSGSYGAPAAGLIQRDPSNGNYEFYDFRPQIVSNGYALEAAANKVTNADLRTVTGGVNSERAVSTLLNAVGGSVDRANQFLVSSGAGTTTVASPQNRQQENANRLAAQGPIQIKKIPIYSASNFSSGRISISASGSISNSKSGMPKNWSY